MKCEYFLNASTFLCYPSLVLSLAWTCWRSLCACIFCYCSCSSPSLAHSWSIGQKACLDPHIMSWGFKSHLKILIEFHFISLQIILLTKAKKKKVSDSSPLIPSLMKHHPFPLTRKHLHEYAQSISFCSNPRVSLPWSLRVFV